MTPVLPTAAGAKAGNPIQGPRRRVPLPFTAVRVTGATAVAGRWSLLPPAGVPVIVNLGPRLHPPAHSDADGPNLLENLARRHAPPLNRHRAIHVGLLTADHAATLVFVSTSPRIHAGAAWPYDMGGLS